MSEELNEDAIAVESPAEVAEAPVEVKVEEPAPVVVEEPKPAQPVAVEPPRREVPQPSAAVSGKNVDDVLLAQCIYKNPAARKSLTVHHLQRRLNELGYTDANADKDGWLGDLTKLAIEKFQKAKGLSVTGSVDADTLKKIFEGDRNVNIIL
jgi:peptidoglycan hydrolase-like protein with peptidoglycan-binding domain